MEAITNNLRRNFEDMRDLGPAIVARFFRRPDLRGYSVARTRYGDFFFRRFDTDLRVLRQIFVDREYDLDRFPQGRIVWDAYDDMLRRHRTPVIVDAGANAGYASRFFAQIYPLAQIFAIEPDAGNAALCRANVANLVRVEVVEAAVGSLPGHVSVEHFAGASWGTRTKRSHSGVPIITIDELSARIPDSELLIVKVDIEGFESDLFADPTWVAQACVVIVELHDWLFPGAGTSRTLQKVMLREDRELLISGENLVWVRSTAMLATS